MAGGRLTKRLAAFVLVLALAVPACAQDSKSAGAQKRGSSEASAAIPLAEPWSLIEFELKSWGRPVSSWRITPEGQGSYTETVEPDGAEFARYDLVWHNLDVGEANYRKLVEAISRIPFPAPEYDECENRITDQPYGSLRINKGDTAVEFRFNAGCMDDSYARLLDPLKKAKDMVDEWGKQGAVLRTEQVGVEGAG